MNRYFDEMVLSASPMELIRLLYQKAIASIEAARQHLNSGRIDKRSQAINNAYLVVTELTASLRPDSAPELSERLAALYAYMQTRLLSANLLQEDAPLAEVQGLLVTLSESWDSIPDRNETRPDSRRLSDSEGRISVTA
ncbi:MAG TPA: flagellar export chaperone FliS [Bryobacteraceae bacterium]|nr:flagellar export chaperone FliS [Bryobacteraceae bacterium]